jgi:hypothetical protein
MVACKSGYQAEPPCIVIPKTWEFGVRSDNVYLHMDVFPKFVYKSYEVPW